MLKDEKNKRLVLDGFKQFVHRFRRSPSLQELASFLGLKKSTLRLVVDKLVADNKMDYERTESGDAIYKSLHIV